MAKRSSVEIIGHFWREVWQSKNPDAVDRLVAEVFIITSGGVEISSREAFKKWVAAFLSSIDDFKFHIVETFQNEAGDRVASRWRVTGPVAHRYDWYRDLACPRRWLAPAQLG